MAPTLQSVSLQRILIEQKCKGRSCGSRFELAARQSEWYLDRKSGLLTYYPRPGEDMAEEAFYCGTHSGRDVDKIAETALALAEAREVSVPLLADAVANFECRITDRLKTGDHTIFVGQVVAAHRNENPPRRLFTLGPGYKMGYPGG